MTITVTVQDVALQEGSSIAASSLVFSTSADSETDFISQWEFEDFGGGGGHFAINGVAQPDNKEILVTDPSTVTYVAGTTPGTDRLYVSVVDPNAGGPKLGGTL